MSPFKVAILASKGYLSDDACHGDSNGGLSVNLNHCKFTMAKKLSSIFVINLSSFDITFCSLLNSTSVLSKHSVF